MSFAVGVEMMLAIASNTEQSVTHPYPLARWGDAIAATHGDPQHRVHISTNA